MDESHFENAGARIFRYSFFLILLAITLIGIWQKDAIMGYFSFREHGESRVVIYAIPSTKVSLYTENGTKREVGFVGRDGKFTLVEKGEINDLRISLYHPNFFPEEKAFSHVPKGETATFYASMAPLLSNILVTSFPSGATVLVDEEEVGITPWRKWSLRDGSHFVVEVKMPGFIPQRREVVIEGGKDEDLVFSLLSSESKISIESTQSEFDYQSLRVFIDGNLYSLEGQQVRFVTPGKRVLEVISHDDLRLQKTINIKPGQTLHLKLPDWFVDDGS